MPAARPRDTPTRRATRHRLGDARAPRSTAPASAQASRIDGTLDGIEVVGHVVDGPPIELERLAAGRQPGGLAGPGERRVEGLAAKPGALVVDRGVDLRRPLEPGPELAGPGVVPAPLRGRDRAIQRVAQELVPEVVQPAESGRVEDELVDELLERRLDRGRRHVHDPGQDIRDEAAADDRAGAGGRLGLG